MTNAKKEYFETFHEYGDKLKEGIILKKIEVNAANTLNYRLTVLDINQENDEGNKETTEVIINIDWKKGTETQEIASETIYTRNINQETDKVEETGQPVIAVHLNKQPNENVEADATASSIPDHIAISYANPLATLMVDRNDGNGYTEVSNNDVFVGTKSGNSENKWQLKDNAFKMKDALDENAILNTTIFDNFLNNSYEINPLQISRRVPELLPFATLGANQRQVSVVASTTSNSLSEELTSEINTRVAEMDNAEAGSIEYKIWQLLNHASLEEESLNDKSNHALAKLRAYSALLILLETEVINEQDIELTLARLSKSPKIALKTLLIQINQD